MSTIARGSFNHVKERLLRAPKRERTSHVARPKSRDERLARVAQLERRESTKRYARYAAFSVAAIVLLAGAAYGISRIPKGPTTVHWHANWKVYVDGEPVRFTDRQFDMSMAKSRIHFHLPDDAKLHLEGPDNRLTLLDLFHSPLKGDISDTKLILPTGSTRPGSFENDANMRLQAYYKPLKGNWTQIESDIASHSMTDGEKVLVSFGNMSAEQILAQQDSIPNVTTV